MTFLETCGPAPPPLLSGLGVGCQSCRRWLPCSALRARDSELSVTSHTNPAKWRQVSASFRTGLFLEAPMAPLNIARDRSLLTTSTHTRFRLSGNGFCGNSEQ